jgi:ABC-2 type transport system permease protein
MSAAADAPPGALPLIRVDRIGPLAGMRNLLRKELGQWWRTRLWWIQVLIWVVLLNGVTTAVMLTEPTVAADDLMRAVTGAFLQIGVTAIGIGVVLTVQGAIVGERELGTAAWVMSKPASRSAFVLAKLIGHAVGFVVTAIAVPAVVFTAEVSILLSQTPPRQPFMAGVGVVTLAVVFYLALTLALGTLFDGQGPVAGVGVVMVLAGVFFKGLLPPVIVYATPWLLGDIAGSIAVGDPLDPNWLVPLVTTALATVALTIVAVWRFGREEL